MMNSRVVTMSAVVCLLLCPLAAQERQSPRGHVTVMGELKVKADREAEFLKLLAEMTARAKQQDKGNIRYELFRAAPFGRGGASETPNFVFIEEWEDEAAFTAHGKWAGAMVQGAWREMTDSMQFVQLTAVSR